MLRFNSLSCNSGSLTSRICASGSLGVEESSMIQHDPARSLMLHAWCLMVHKAETAAVKCGARTPSHLIPGAAPAGKTVS